MESSPWPSLSFGDKSESCRLAKRFSSASAATAWPSFSLGRVPLFGESAVTGLLVALIVPAIAAYIFGRLLFLGRGLSGAYFAIVTLCAAVLAQTLAEQSSYLGGFNGLLGIPPFTAPWHGRDAYMTPGETYYLMLAIAALIFVGLLWIVRSPLGTVLAAIREDDRRTAFFGYDVTRFKVWAFVTSAAISGAAGALFVKQFGFVSPSLIGFALSTEVLIWVAVGGRQIVMAAFLGALIVRWIEGQLSERLGNFWLLALGLLFAAPHQRCEPKPVVARILGELAAHRVPPVIVSGLELALRIPTPLAPRPLSA